MNRIMRFPFPKSFFGVEKVDIKGLDGPLSSNNFTSDVSADINNRLTYSSEHDTGNRDDAKEYYTFVRVNPDFDGKTCGYQDGYNQKPNKPRVNNVYTHKYIKSHPEDVELFNDSYHDGYKIGRREHLEDISNRDVWVDGYVDGIRDGAKAGKFAYWSDDDDSDCILDNYNPPRQKNLSDVYERAYDKGCDEAYDKGFKSAYSDDLKGTDSQCRD